MITLFGSIACGKDYDFHGEHLQPIFANENK